MGMLGFDSIIPLQTAGRAEDLVKASLKFNC